ncbi:MAG: hypothetical protein EXR95_03135 [Gemmatimonadetes bacterium]|nr:hypothetical protein [Gemmatimonadota bacterium]
MITQAFLAGGATLVAAVVVHALWLAALPRSVYPQCGQATAGVSHLLSARTDRWMRRRWCTGCGWKGWGRNGPVHWRRRGPVSDGSGFRWGQDRLQPDFGFRWAGRSEAPSAASGPPVDPAHPSGFRWADDPEDTATACAQSTDHPSGFRWAGAPVESAEPAGFQWRGPRPGRPPVPAAAPFRWKD